MKTIDWKKVALDKDISHQFAVAINNKFQVLYPDIVLEQSNLTNPTTVFQRLQKKLLHNCYQRRQNEHLSNQQPVL
jgi:hypothetical protein